MKLICYNSKISFFLISLILITITEIKAQTPKIISINPTFNAISNSSDPEISVKFDVSMDSSSFNNLSFSVMGERSGDHSGEISYLEENKTVFFISNDMFNAGERVTVTLSNKIKSSIGDALKGFIWTFRIPSKQGGS